MGAILAISCAEERGLNLMRTAAKQMECGVTFGSDRFVHLYFASEDHPAAVERATETFAALDPEWDKHCVISEL